MIKVNHIPVQDRFLKIMIAAALMAVVFLLIPALGLAQSRPSSFSGLAGKLSPAVVNIATTTVVEGQQQFAPQFPPGSPFEDFLDEFSDRGSKRRFQSLGSGFIIDNEGIVVTNNHVIESADEIKVTLANDKTFDAELLGRDPKTDIAVLRFDPDGEKLSTVKFGNSNSLNVGDWVLAIGNPFGLGGTVTAGIVSARGRDIGTGPYDDFIQTDASINRGNSGGPLFNLDGEVIGINTVIFSQTGGSVGIGFAIASNLATNVVDQLVEFGRTQRGWLGVYIQEITPEIAESLGLKSQEGALVSSVHPDGPAEDGGIRAGDVILSFNGEEIEDMRSLPRIVAETDIGKKVKVLVMREGNTKTLTVELGELEVAEKAGLITGSVAPPANPHSFASLGFTVVPITDAIRNEYGIPDTEDGEPLNGVVVIEVAQGSPASERGIEVGDVIRRIDQKQVMSPDDLAAGIEDAKRQKKTSFLLLVRSEGLGQRFVAIPVE
jgi:serine protease Do